ncbi:hypothetical protein A3C89_02715 [Candidatus Kaiserbacteria bacterium RIFCSPHIGHO2_02_FULL_50_50]|uniref:Endolytic murein transglycosylase n=1 Tax=Candidatus Kaiserbacteria bacterium RIFCSPHIGHO2_02_FULL_50_50 TaxID=1798492 RepID=A0A1F6DD88_9BACT|nr:MAG: hypothetical protein A3C89_02715 [Candidatus Kaiserbacteria bacterium RIFCSPHIGHO2_02_FULL_50_50]OGG89156.1 MAG: hypothetical protein A3G62_00215 [Candidatus Kaiserbacteria bacterium RIFCSPLOWO2_12_FULL_50_10]
MRRVIWFEIIPRRYIWVVRAVYFLVLAIALPFATLTAYIAMTFDASSLIDDRTKSAFPISVDPMRRSIRSDNAFETFIASDGTAEPIRSLLTDNPVTKWIGAVAQDSALSITMPASKVVVIYAGQRKEEAARDIGYVLGWSKADRDVFLTQVAAAYTDTIDGQFYPGSYIVPKKARPAIVAQMVIDRFATEILGRYEGIEEPSVPLKDALIIASLIEREAYNLEDGRIISGVIWNRLFVDMALQLDATLQYSRGTAASWWPTPRAADKAINSPFNTYKNKGLPPEPISNPTRDTVLLALNPAITDCLFYFHQTRTKFHCSETYEEHVQKLRSIYGQGK